MGRRPHCFNDSCTSHTDSDEWVCRPVSNSSASATPAAKHAGEQYMRCSSPTQARTRPPAATRCDSSSARLVAIVSK